MSYRFLRCRVLQLLPGMIKFSLGGDSMLIPDDRTTLKIALPTTRVKTGSSTLMSSQRSCSTASQPLARPTSSQSENKALSTRNTTEMDSRRLSLRGHVGDLVFHYAGLFISARTIKFIFNQTSTRTMLVSVITVYPRHVAQSLSRRKQSC